MILHQWCIGLSTKTIGSICFNGNRNFNWHCL